MRDRDADGGAGRSRPGGPEGSGGRAGRCAHVGASSEEVRRSFGQAPPGGTGLGGGTGDAEARFLWAYRADVALEGLASRVQALLAGLEARPATEGPLQACRALIDTDGRRALAVGPDDLLVMGLVADSLSLAGRMFWAMQGIVGLLAVEFARRLGVEPGDLRAQLLASGVVAGLNAALLAWLADPSGPTVEELARRALDDLAGGMGWPSGRAAS